MNLLVPPTVIICCLQTENFLQHTGYEDSASFFGGPKLEEYLMGLGQGNKGAPPSWIQLSSIISYIFCGIDYEAQIIFDPISRALIHMIGAMFVINTDMYRCHEPLFNVNDLFVQL